MLNGKRGFMFGDGKERVMDQGNSNNVSWAVGGKDLLALARKARNNEEYQRAADYYDDLLDKEPNNWEAAYYSMFCRLDYSNVRRQIDTALTIDDTMAKVIELLATANLIPQEKYYAVKNISEEIRELATKLFDSFEVEKMDPNSFRRYKKLTLSWCKALFTIGYSVYDYFVDTDWKTANLSTMCLEKCNEIANRLLEDTYSLPRLRYYSQAKKALMPYIEDATETIQVFDQHYVAPKANFRFF